MQLVIANGFVISYFRDGQQASAPEGAEIVQWDGPMPENVYQDDGTISFALDPRTDEQKLTNAKQKKLQELQAWDLARRNTGVAFGSYTMKSAEYDQRRIATLLVAINESLDQEAMTLETDINIWDASGVKQTITVAAYKAAIPGYTFSCQTQENEYAALAASIEVAESQSELDTITFE